MAKSLNFLPTTIESTTTTPLTTITSTVSATTTVTTQTVTSTTNPPHPTLVTEDDFTVTPVSVRQFRPKKSRFAQAENMVKL